MVSATFGGLVKRDKTLNRRPFILSRSFFAGSQKYAVVWTGDNAVNWEHLRNSIQLVLSYGIAGMVYSGSDVGGFFNGPDPNLLARWYQVGAWTYPFFRCHCHHLSPNREVYLLKDQFQKVVREAIVDRYQLLPYWYTLARHANVTGDPIVRPLWWEFPEGRFLDVDDRVMVGRSLLVTPFLTEFGDPIRVQFPINTRWFNYQSLEEIKAIDITVDYNEGRTSVFIRGGSIIPIKRILRKSTTLMFWDPFTLIVAVDAKGIAEGELYVDDCDTFDFGRGQFVHRKFTFNGTVFSSTSLNPQNHERFARKYDAVIEQIRIAGLVAVPEKVLNSNGNELRIAERENIVIIHRTAAPVKEDFQLTFEH
jgi:alpha 1,3-glucosidase